MNDNIFVKTIIDENFQDYKKASMFIAFPKCDFKCFRELNLHVSGCQNYQIAKMENVEISIENIFFRYKNNPITDSIVLGGLEPFDSFDDVYSLVNYFRANDCNDDFVIYSGYYPDEIENKLEKLKKFKNIIVKFGRFIPKSLQKFDNILGVNLASANQFAIVL